METNRRQFLKILGISTLSGLGSIPAIWALTPNSELQTPNSGKRWAMVVDMKKFKTEDDYKKCIDACHSVHNVPDFGNPKDEVKWIWKMPYKNTFPEQEDDYISGEMKNMPFMVLCNHCKRHIFHFATNIIIFLFRKCIFIRHFPYPFNLILWVSKIRDIVDTMAGIYTLFIVIFCFKFLHIYNHCPPLS